MPTYHGSCHCGAVTFSLVSDITELTTCDCSLCRQKNALMTKVHESALTIDSGEDLRMEYAPREAFLLLTLRHLHVSPQARGAGSFRRQRVLSRGFRSGPVPVRATEGIGMSVVEHTARSQWPGPREAG